MKVAGCLRNGVKRRSQPALKETIHRNHSCSDRTMGIGQGEACSPKILPWILRFHTFNLRAEVLHFVFGRSFRRKMLFWNFSLSSYQFTIHMEMKPACNAFKWDSQLGETLKWSLRFKHSTRVTQTPFINLSHGLQVEAGICINSLCMSNRRKEGKFGE